LDLSSGKRERVQRAVTALLEEKSIRNTVFTYVNGLTVGIIVTDYRACTYIEFDPYSVEGTE
jgi:hypothetical protein